MIGALILSLTERHSHCNRTNSALAIAKCLLLPVSKCLLGDMSRETLFRLGWANGSGN